MQSKTFGSMSRERLCTLPSHIAKLTTPLWTLPKPLSPLSAGPRSHFSQNCCSSPTHRPAPASPLNAWLDSDVFLPTSPPRSVLLVPSVMLLNDVRGIKDTTPYVVGVVV